MRGGYGERFPDPVIADEGVKTFADVCMWLWGLEILVVTEVLAGGWIRGAY